MAKAGFSSPGLYNLLKDAKMYWPDRFDSAQKAAFRAFNVEYVPDLKALHIAGITRQGSGVRRISGNSIGFLTPATDRYGQFRNPALKENHSHLVDFYIYMPEEAEEVGAHDRLLSNQILITNRDSGKSYGLFKPDPRTASVTVRCNCEDFRFTFMYSLNLIDGLYGQLIPYRKVPGSTRPRRNKHNRPGLCKHILALIKIAMDSNLFVKKVRLW